MLSGSGKFQFGQQLYYGYNYTVYILQRSLYIYVQQTIYTRGEVTLTKMKRLLQGCSLVAATMQQSNMYATTGGDKVANKSG